MDLINEYLNWKIENHEIHCYYSNLKSIKIREYKNKESYFKLRIKLRIINFSKMFCTLINITVIPPIVSIRRKRNKRSE